MATSSRMLRQQAFTAHNPSGSRRTVPCAARPAATSLRCEATPETSRRQLLGVIGGVATTLALSGSAAVAAPEQLSTPSKQLCEADCVAGLESLPLITTASGLQYRDIVTGKGPNPPVGFQVVVHYVAMTPAGRVFDSSLDKGKPYDVRVGAGQVVAGLDEGMLTMKPGGVRRLYIPGSLSFPNGLKSAPGRPAVPPASPVVFDVQLLYIPGLDDEDE